jgi:hypothetical protein
MGTIWVAPLVRAGTGAYTEHHKGKGQTLDHVVASIARLAFIQI